MIQALKWKAFCALERILDYVPEWMSGWLLVDVIFRAYMWVGEDYQA